MKYSKGQPPLEIILEIIFRGTGAPSLGRGDVLGNTRSHLAIESQTVGETMPRPRLQRLGVMIDANSAKIIAKATSFGDTWLLRGRRAIQRRIVHLSRLLHNTIKRVKTRLKFDPSHITVIYSLYMAPAQNVRPQSIPMIHIRKWQVVLVPCTRPL